MKLFLSRSRPQEKIIFYFFLNIFLRIKYFFVVFRLLQHVSFFIFQKYFNHKISIIFFIKIKKVNLVFDNSTRLFFLVCLFAVIGCFIKLLFDNLFTLFNGYYDTFISQFVYFLNVSLKRQNTKITTT